MATTFFITLIAWIFFRATSIEHALAYLTNMFTKTWISYPLGFIIPIPLIVILLLVEWAQRNTQYALQISFLPTPVRWTIYTVLAVMCIGFYEEKQTFIYFAF